MPFSPLKALGLQDKKTKNLKNTDTRTYTGPQPDFPKLGVRLCGLPLNQLGCQGKHCKLHQLGLGQSPGYMHFYVFPSSKIASTMTFFIISMEYLMTTANGRGRFNQTRQSHSPIATGLIQIHIILMVIFQIDQVSCMPFSRTISIDHYPKHPHK